MRQAGDGPLGCRVYLITPETLDPVPFADRLAAALDGGDVAAVQLRLKNVDDDVWRRAIDVLRPMTQSRGVALLLIAEASGLLVEPPVVSEADRAVIVKAGGQAAAVADRVFRINRVARIVTSGRNWRLYLERDWGRVEPPPDILLPKDDTERAAWTEYVKRGWDEGVQQAEETFEADLDRMTADYVGMIRYRELLAQGMISPPFTLADDRGITGGGSEMRIGDRGLAITGQSQLIPRSGEWTPAPR